MFKKLIYIFCFTFWLVPKLSAQDNFIELERRTTTVSDFGYEFDYNLRRYLSPLTAIEMLDSISIYKWDTMAEKYIEVKRLRWIYTDYRRCYSAEAIDLSINKIYKKATQTYEDNRLKNLMLYRASYSETEPCEKHDYDLFTPYKLFNGQTGKIATLTDYANNNKWIHFIYDRFYDGTVMRHCFADSISDNNYRYSTIQVSQIFGKFQATNSYKTFNNFSTNAADTIYGNGYQSDRSYNYQAFDSVLKKKYLLTFKRYNYWILSDSIKKEYRNNYDNYYIDNFVNNNGNWEYQYSDTMIYGYLYKRRYSYYVRKGKPAILDIYQAEKYDAGPFDVATATFVPSMMLNNHLADDLDSLNPQYSIHNPIDFADPSKIVRGLAGVNVRYIGETIDFPRDKEFDDNEQEIIAAYKVVMHYTNIGSLVGNQEVKKNAQISVYPNPVNSVLHIELPHTETRVIEIVDLNGVIVASQNTNNAPEQINVGNLSSGLYVLRCVNTNGEITNTKFMKQ
jgi:hypothetical protein